MGPAYLKAIREHAHVNATVRIDPFHVMMNTNKALDVGPTRLLERAA